MIFAPTEPNILNYAPPSILAYERPFDILDYAKVEPPCEHQS